MAKSAISKLKRMNLLSRLHVLKACLPSIGLPDNDRAQECINALRRCAEAIGATPTSREYEAWRLAQPDADFLPKRGYIENTFGGWNKATAWVGGTYAPDITWRGDSNGEAYSKAEVVSSIHEWLSELTVVETKGGLALAHPAVEFKPRVNRIGAPPSAPFMRWARTRTDGCRHVSTFTAIQRHFSGWPEAVSAALAKGGIDDAVVLLIRLSLLSRDELARKSHQIISDAVNALGVGVTQGALDKWLDETDAERSGEERDLYRALRSSRILALHSSWPDAISEATGTPLDNIPFRGHRQIGDAALIEILRKLALSLGSAPTWTEYKRERADRRRELPHEGTFIRAFGKWEFALAAAFGGEVR